MATSRLNIILGADNRQLKRGLAASERRLYRFNRTVGRFADSINRNFTLPFALASAAGVKFASDLEDNFSKIENLVGVTGGTLDTFKGQIRTLSEEVGQSQSSLSEALFVVTSAGERGATAMDILEQSAKASAIGMGETQQVARAVTSVMQAYGSETMSAAAATDTMTAIVREGNLEASSLAPVLGRVIGIASKMGVSFQEVGANIATFTRLGVSAEEATTALRSTLNTMLKPSAQAKEALAQIGLTSQELRDQLGTKGLAQTLIDLIGHFEGNQEALTKVIPNVRALSGVLGTAGAQGKEYVRIVESISDATGIVDKGFENVAENSSMKFRKALISLQNAAIDLGNAIMPVAMELTKVLTSIAKGFSGLEKGTQKTIVKIGVFISMMGLSLKALSMFTGAIHGGIKMVQMMIPAVRSATTTVAAFNTVTKGVILGGLIAAIGGAIAMYRVLSRSMDEVISKHKAFENVQATATEKISRQRSEIEALTSRLKESNVPINEQREILKQLNEISGGYFETIKAGKIDIEKLENATQDYINTLMRQAKVEAFKDKIADLQSEMADATISANKGEMAWKDYGKAAGIALIQLFGGHEVDWDQATGTIAVGKAKNRMIALNEEMKLYKELLKDAISANITLGNEEGKKKNKNKDKGGGGGGVGRPMVTIPDLLPNASDVDTVMSRLRSSIQSHLGGIDEDLQASVINFTNPLTALGEKFSIIEAKGEAFGDSFDVVSAKIRATQAAITSMIEGGMSPMSMQVQFLIRQLGILQEQQDKAMKAEKWESFAARFQETINAGVVNTLTSVASAFGQMVTGVKKANLGKAILMPLLNMLQRVGKLAIAAGIAIEGIKKALTSLNPIVAIAAGTALIALTGLIKSRLSAAAETKTPQLAEGGLATGPTLAVVGDNPNAGADPEVIAPLSRLSGMLQDALGKIVSRKGFDSRNYTQRDTASARTAFDMRIPQVVSSIAAPLLRKSVRSGVQGGGDMKIEFGKAEVAGDKLLLVVDRAKMKRKRTGGF